MSTKHLIVFSELFLFQSNNRFNLTWILHQITINSNKVKLVAGPFTTFSILLLTIRPTNDVQVSNQNWRQFFPCHNIHVYSISFTESKLKSTSICTFWRTTLDVTVLILAIFVYFSECEYTKHILQYSRNFCPSENASFKRSKIENIDHVVTGSCFKKYLYTKFQQ